MTEPDRLYIDDTDRELYKKLEGMGLFKDRNNKEQFMFAASYAVMKQCAREPLKSKDGFFLVSYLREEDVALFNALAIYENKTIAPEEVIRNKEFVYKIVEEYAHAGIQMLSQTKIDETFWLLLEKMLYDNYSELNK